jgi:hypothetical protein
MMCWSELCQLEHYIGEETNSWSLVKDGFAARRGVYRAYYYLIWSGGLGCSDAVNIL